MRKRTVLSLINGYVLFKTSDYVAARDAALEQSQALIERLDSIFTESENKAIMGEIKDAAHFTMRKLRANIVKNTILRSTDDQVRKLAREAATYNNMVT